MKIDCNSLDLFLILSKFAPFEAKPASGEHEEGQYYFTGPDGRTYQVKYIYDENGFHPETSEFIWDLICIEKCETILIWMKRKTFFLVKVKELQKVDLKEKKYSNEY